MAFNSLEFLVFLPLALGLFYLVPARWHWLPLLLASAFFYALFKPGHLALLATSTLIDQATALGMGASRSTRARLGFMALGAVHNIGLLIFFKYAFLLPFVPQALSARSAAGAFAPALGLAAPVGLSYLTFKKLSYLIDVFRGNIPPERHVGKFALYVFFFPALVSGPIERAGSLLPQISAGSGARAVDLTDGLKLILWGGFKKLVIADNLAPAVNTVFGHPGVYMGPQLILAAFFFSFQIFCDFSGYTDIALGTARLFGIRLTQNFDRPYAAVSIADFWRRWHITLSSWLRDYLFLPIAFRIDRGIRRERLWGIKPEAVAYVLATMLTMLACGAWHGARWTFVIWGGLHGLLLSLSFATKKLRRRCRRALGIRPQQPLYRRFQTTITFLAISLLWIVFRSETPGQAYEIILRLFSGVPTFCARVIAFLRNLDVDSLFRFLTTADLGTANFSLLIAVTAIAVMAWVHRRQSDTSRPLDFMVPWSTWLRWLGLYGLLFWTLIAGRFDDVTFIYPQF